MLLKGLHWFDGSLITQYLPDGEESIRLLPCWGMLTVTLEYSRNGENAKTSHSRFGGLPVTKVKANIGISVASVHGRLGSMLVSSKYQRGFATYSAGMAAW